MRKYTYYILFTFFNIGVLNVMLSLFFTLLLFDYADLIYSLARIIFIYSGGRIHNNGDLNSGVNKCVTQ